MDQGELWAIQALGVPTLSLVAWGKDRSSHLRAQGHSVAELLSNLMLHSDCRTASGGEVTRGASRALLFYYFLGKLARISLPRETVVGSPLHTSPAGRGHITELAEGSAALAIGFEFRTFRLKPCPVWVVLQVSESSAQSARAHKENGPRYGAKCSQNYNREHTELPRTNAAHGLLGTRRLEGTTSLANEAVFLPNFVAPPARAHEVPLLCCNRIFSFDTHRALTCLSDPKARC